MPSALVTGATGQDGSYLVERLAAEGWQVHAIVRATTADGETELPAPVTPLVGDLLDPPSLVNAIAAAEPDVVFNLAGMTSVAASWDDPVLAGRLSGLAVATLFDAAWRWSERRGKPVSFVQATSAEIFGDAVTAPQDESTAIAPVNPYGAAKAYAHALTGVYRRRGMAASSAILYNHESPRRPTAFVTRKITDGVARISLGLAETIALGNLDARRDWGWAPDYVDALIRMATPDQADDYVIATGVDHSVRDFVAAAFARVGIADWESRVVIDPTFARPVDAPRLVGDSTRARRRLGWAPTIGFEELVGRMVDHDRAALSGDVS